LRLSGKRLRLGGERLRVGGERLRVRSGRDAEDCRNQRAEEEEPE
jgi:hypothetical protein